jgi:hypothetical protein
MNRGQSDRRDPCERVMDMNRNRCSSGRKRNEKQTEKKRPAEDQQSACLQEMTYNELHYQVRFAYVCVCVFIRTCTGLAVLNPAAKDQMKISE